MPGPPPPAARQRLDLALSEALEIAAFSLALALVVKLFVVEVYEIPSGSMQPTLLGDAATGRHDRIVADKTVTLLRGPERWEIAIFRHPLDERRLYVKRVAGLPGETLEILGGDLWIDGVLAIKPEHVLDSLLKDISPGTPAGLLLASAFAADPGVTCEGTRALFAGPGKAGLVLRRSVRDEPLHGCDPAWGLADNQPAVHAVADLEIAFDVTPGEGCEALTIGFDSDEGLLELRLPVAGSAATPAVSLPPLAGQLIRRVDLGGVAPQPLTAGRSQRVVARHVDRRLAVSIDGEPWLTWDDVDAGPRSDGPRRALLRLALTGAGSVDAVRVRRDTYYLPESRRRAGQPHRWEIPEHCYFMLGDNTQNSHDSRSWQALELSLPDGRRLRGHDFPAAPGSPPSDDANPRPAPDGQLLFTDVHGDSWVLDPAELLDLQRVAAPFVERRYLLGKPTAIVWPAPRWDLVR